MIENMKVEFGRTSDIDSWMRLVRKVSWNFPGLETEQSIDEHKIIVLKFMNDKRALCVKNEQEIVGVLLYSRKHNMICCLAVDPAYRKRGIASILLKEALDKLDRDKDITVSTFRENDVKGIAPRKLYKKFRFIYLILLKRCIFKAFRLPCVPTLCIFPCFCPYEPKQGKVFYSPPTTLSSSLAEVRFASLVA